MDSQTGTSRQGEAGGMRYSDYELVSSESGLYRKSFTPSTNSERDARTAPSFFKYYRLHASGITANGCWLVNPKMVQITDINVSTGLDVTNGVQIYLGTGAVPSAMRFKKEGSN